MMWPILTKVQYERVYKSKKLWRHIAISLVPNWAVGPFPMLGLARATLPGLQTYHTGVIPVGIARCIVTVMIWNDMTLPKGAPYIAPSLWWSMPLYRWFYFHYYHFCSSTSLGLQTTTSFL